MEGSGRDEPVMEQVLTRQTSSVPVYPSQAQESTAARTGLPAHVLDNHWPRGGGRVGATGPPGRGRALSVPRTETHCARTLHSAGKPAFPGLGGKKAQESLDPKLLKTGTQ